MNNKKRYMIASVFLTILIVFIWANPFKKEIWDTNAKLLEDKILTMEIPDEPVNLTEFTPFEWDKVYSFPAYYTKEDVYDTVGYKWDRIKETVNEGMNQIVFMKEGEVVCYIYGYPSNNKFGISFNHGEYSYGDTVLYAKDNEVFTVVKKEDVTYLNFEGEE
ncbi:hypothetical protein ACIQXQ_10545 [Peribacillus sp. NPDC097198]|uniref:hypothetical protein n=1 Tax=Peribacillus sp. NPDC097198 TaxID=3364397 RepID=UPI0038158CE3